ncbi:hypothetical protein A7K69_10185 [Parageobacillus thermoglucosidasius]|uniref:Uncharacterized protein n=1 Tax=Parageobacillus thermoglucosidasius TaxID=1426 RepID=A0A1B7KR12_PARTM|nr:hypothetical protein A7K69_10185 [Parageobacillus thermoglucosidasius]
MSEPGAEAPAGLPQAGRWPAEKTGAGLIKGLMDGFSGLKDRAFKMNPSRHGEKAEEFCPRS